MKKAGRPPRTPSEDERKKVKDLLAVNASIADMAKMLGYSKPTFRKYFSAEIFTAKKSAEEKTAPFKITELDREKVVRYIGCQMAIEQVAHAMDLTIEELEEHFAPEIQKGQAKYRAKVIDHLDDQMRQGVSGATNRLEAITVILSGDDKPAGNAAGHIIGKKAAATAAAAGAVLGGGRFAPMAAPKLAVDNTK
jgi:AcrR family transcriptional regulator